jgi:hypothetical protein
VFITVLSFIAISKCCCLFKIYFTSSHSVKPLFPTYKPREWNKKSKKWEFNHLNMNKEVEPLRQLNEVETYISPKSTNADDMPSMCTNCHAMKF